MVTDNPIGLQQFSIHHWSGVETIKRNANGGLIDVARRHRLYLMIKAGKPNRKGKTMNTKEIKARSAELAKTGKAWGNEVHKHLLDIAKHIGAHKDCTVATHFYTLLRMQSGETSSAIVRTDAIKNWLEAFAFCKWGKDKSGKAAFKLNTSARDSVMETTDPKVIDDHFANATRNPWNKYTPAPKDEPVFDMDAVMTRFMKTAFDKDGKKTEQGKAHKVDHAKLVSLREYLRDNGWTVNV